MIRNVKALCTLVTDAAPTCGGKRKSINNAAEAKPAELKK